MYRFFVNELAVTCDTFAEVLAAQAEMAQQLIGVAVCERKPFAHEPLTNGVHKTKRVQSRANRDAVVQSWNRARRYAKTRGITTKEARTILSKK